MRTLTRCRGATLLEVLLVLTLLVSFAAASHAVVRMAAVQANEALRRAAAGRDQVALWALVARELAHAESGDVAVPVGTALEFDRPVVEGPVCDLSATSVWMRSDHGGVLRLPVAGRDRQLARESTTTGGWVGRGIVSVSVANCPDLRPAIVLGLDTPVPAVGFVRIVEPVRLRGYASGGSHAVGLESRAGGATIQPLAGPLDPNAFDAAMSTSLLTLTFSRAPLAPLHLSIPLAP